MVVRKSCARNRAAIAKAESPGEGPSELLCRPPITHPPKKASRSPRQPPIPPGRPLCVKRPRGGRRLSGRAQDHTAWAFRLLSLTECEQNPALVCEHGRR